MPRRHRLASVDPENGDELAWGVRTFNSQTGKALAPLTPEQARAQYLASVSGAAGLEEFTSDWIVPPDFGVEP